MFPTACCGGPPRRYDHEHSGVTALSHYCDGVADVIFERGVAALSTPARQIKNCALAGLECHGSRAFPWQSLATTLGAASDPVVGKLGLRNWTPPLASQVPIPMSLLEDKEESEEESLSGKIPVMQLAPGATTLVVRNISVRFSQARMLDALPASTWSYDLLYLPFNWRQRRASGYMFINFISPEAAVAFGNHWHGRLFPNSVHRKAKSLNIGCAVLQGLEENILMSRTKLNRIVNHNLLPAIFYDGVRLDFWSWPSRVQWAEPEMPLR